MGTVSRPASKLALVVGAVLLLTVAACGDGGEKQVSGFVLRAVERSITEIESLRLQDDDGLVWEFTTQGPVGTSASHLRQHRLAGERIIVTYREVDGLLIASDITDADDSGG